MTIKARLKRLENKVNPEEPEVFKVYMPGIDGTMEDIEASLRKAEARGESVYRVRFPPPRYE